MENVTDIKIQSEIDKQVESTILKRKVEWLERKRKKYFSWKGFGLISLMGLVIGLFLANTLSEDRDRYYEVAESSFFFTIRRNAIDKKTLDEFIETKKDKRLNRRAFDNNFAFGDYDDVDTVAVVYSDTISSNSELITPEKPKSNAEIKSEAESNNKILEKAYQSYVSSREQWDIRIKKEFIKMIFFTILIFNLIYLIIVGILSYVWRSTITKLKLEIINIGALQLKDNLNNEQEKDFFTQLVKINFKYLDQYYLQTQEQADKSFWLSAIASIVGFVMILIGIGLMYYKEDGNSGIAATSSGIISQFIAAIFFYLYNRTILKMS